MSNLLEENLIDSMDEKSKGTILRSMAIFSVIELFGSFLTGETGQGTTKKNFITFCESKYIPVEYRVISSLLFSIFRNGVSHSYVPKGAALLTSDLGAKNFHLHFCESGLCIYVPQLAEDVVAAIKKFIIDLKQEKKLKENYYNVFSQLDRVGKEIYHEYIKDNNIKTQTVEFQGDINIDL
ncbi:MAG: hypothetical protein NTZ49_02910 [Candidatus Parcubacteria bacterium]|nr:hypothetical protein [Candidatus Parcubacteria bacterium]